MLRSEVASNFPSISMKIILDKQRDGCVERKGGDVVSGDLEVFEYCLAGYDFSIRFEG